MTQTAEASPERRAARRLRPRFVAGPRVLARGRRDRRGGGGFLLHQLMAWPPHEDETLALFVGRDSLAGVVEHVTRERGGAPLHFLVA